MSDKYKTCWACKWFVYEESTPDYSDVTPGEPCTIRCEKKTIGDDGRERHRFWKEGVSEETLRECINMAKACPDFEDRE